MAQVYENHDPETFAEASGNSDLDAAMDEEYLSLMVNDTWDLVPLPKGRKIVRCKWIYRTKYASYGSVGRLMERLVAKHFSQVEGIDYNETFSPVAKMNSIHLVLSLVALHNWEVHQMDVKYSFLHGDLQEEIWNNLLDMFGITLALSVALRNTYMALSKLLELGMPKWIAFSLTLFFLDVIMNPIYVPKK